MEPSQDNGTASERQLNVEDKTTESLAKNNDDSSIKLQFKQNATEPAIKSKPNKTKSDAANLNKIKVNGRNKITGRRGRTHKVGTPNRMTSLEDMSSSDTDDYSTTESDDSSSSQSESSSSSSSSDEEEIRKKHKTKRRRKSRAISRHRSRRARDTIKTTHRTESRLPLHKDVNLQLGPANGSDLISQHDIRNSLAQLELRCTQLQQQIDCFGNFQASATNRPLQKDPPGVNPTFYNNLKPAVSLDRPFISGIRGSSTRPISPGPVTTYHDMPMRAETNGPHHHSQKNKKLDFKRVDAVWDSKVYAFKLQDTAKIDKHSKYNGYLFHVRRTFDSEGKYRATFVDIKSKLLRECLQEVIGIVRGVNLLDETPKLDPNLLFLYLEDFRLHLRKLKAFEPTGKNRRERHKNQHRLDNKRKQLKVLIKYLDKDYSKVKDSLFPMLDSGIITFEYLWALWKPNTLAYASTYGHSEDPRVFKVDMAVRVSSLFQGTSYVVEGKYLEFDGKRFGHGSVTENIAEFHGTRKICSLPFYPLSFHKNESSVRQMLVERGKKFVSLNGAHFKAYSGLAYKKRKKGSVTKFHIQPSRIMVDPAIFRRINPNYFVSPVLPRDFDALSESALSDAGADMDDYFSSDDAQGGEGLKVISRITKGPSRSILVTKALQADLKARNKLSLSQEVPSETGDATRGVNSSGSSTGEKLANTPKEESVADLALEFTDEDYLLASPVVLGFSFSEKQWLEFSVSRICEIQWNEDAWDSLVLPIETKVLIQALVKSRKNNLAQTIDDVIQGKGKGLVTVLHGPPGTGKTLTAEGISELLQCPLYMASAGELGTNPRFLETELQKILDTCHSWGAILLLDEADVFLEKRNMQDIHRNALVSIFLRQLEYFQGILFLTTNRVETFDEAFQSRIHIALRYDGLDSKAKKSIFKMFIDRVESHGKLSVEPFTDEDLSTLAKHELNGREIKNVIGSAQDLALNKAEPLSIRHIQQVLDIHTKFGRDIRGGTGYEDAMRSYC